MRRAAPFGGSDFRQGMAFCVRTSEGRFSLVKITKFRSPNIPIELRITTFKKETD